MKYMSSCYVQVFSHWEHTCLHDTKQLFRSLLSGRNFPLSGVSSTSLILADRIVQSYRVVSTKEDILVLVIGSCPLGIRWQGRNHFYTITLLTRVDDELPFIFHSLPPV